MATYRAVYVSIEQDRVIEFRIGAQHYLKPGRGQTPDDRYDDVVVKVDGREREFTLTDFLTRLGFIEKE